MIVCRSSWTVRAFFFDSVPNSTVSSFQSYEHHQVNDCLAVMETADGKKLQSSSHDYLGKCSNSVAGEVSNWVTGRLLKVLWSDGFTL